MSRLLAFLILLPGTCVRAQVQLAERLANEVCACMENITDEPPRTYARGCLRQIAATNRRLLSRNFDRAYDPERPADLDALAAFITKPLAADCPILQTLYAPGGEREFRWSDQRVANADANRLRYNKNPPPDPPENILTERPPQTIITGVVTHINRLEATVQGDNDQPVTIEIPPSQRRTLSIEAGQTVRLSCRREWRPETRRIALILNGQ